MAKRERRPALIGSLLSEARVTTARRAGVALDRQTWIEVVGERIAGRAAPGRLEAGVLQVVVESPVWAQELSLLSEEIRARLGQRGLSVQQIRFRTGNVAPAERLVRELPPRVRPAPLPADVQERLARVEDAALRATIADAIQHSLGAAEQAATTKLKPKPAAPAPRSAASKSDPPDRDGQKAGAAGRHSRGAGRG